MVEYKSILNFRLVGLPQFDIQDYLEKISAHFHKNIVSIEQTEQPKGEIVNYIFRFEDGEFYQLIIKKAQMNGIFTACYQGIHTERMNEIFNYLEETLKPHKISVQISYQQ